jgi:hypothetical protein
VRIYVSKSQVALKTRVGDYYKNGDAAWKR